MTSPAEAPVAGVGRENTDRILRMFARFTSVGYLAYLALLYPSIITTAPLMHRWWTPLAVVVVFGTGVLPGLLSFRRGTAAMRTAAAVAAMAFLAAAFTWPLAWTGAQLPGDDGVWLAAFPGLASLAGIIAWPTGVAFTHLVIGCTTVQMINLAARVNASASMLVPDITFAIMFCTLFVGGAAMALRTGRLLDATTESTRAAAAGAAAQRARAVERERFDALVHDGVIATLLTASRPVHRENVRALAATTLRELDDLHTIGNADQDIALDEILAQLRSATVDVDPSALFVVTGTETAETLRIPVSTVRSMSGALAEALRNSHLHAGPRATRTVTAALQSDSISIAIADDGVGFDHTSIPPHRLGIAVSILGRMRHTAGGSARVDSEPGRGTTVHIEWTAP
ncbi:sensor histidine kinase [Rhodococcus baikonurensis]|uniref:sensor histidine kinase n=1 Tax=Rhodococcus baikonurensis TaxID=172041 RepID=UPI0037B6C8D1